MAPEVLRDEPYNEKADVFSYGIILCEVIARIQADPDFLPRTENFGLDYHTFQHMVGDCPPDFLQLAFNCCNMDPKLRPSFADIVRQLEEILARLKVVEMENESVSLTGEKIQAFKRLNPLVCQNDKIPPKSPWPRRNIWLSRSQSDIFSCQPGRKINVQDPYYNPPSPQRNLRTRKINPFTAREDLCGGKIKFYDVPSKSVFSLVFDLHSPPGSETSFYWQQLPGRSDAAPILNDMRQKAVPSGWARKYVVVEIPPFCRQRGGCADDGVAPRTENTSGQSWSPMLTGSETDSAEAMDCSGGREEEKPDRGTESCLV
uniref:Protein kinase domain-containing protein n=1 Tax=Xiphophorus couchianus TaxID=32473 RepID=A0A3B5MX01_9TELE